MSDLLTATDNRMSNSSSTPSGGDSANVPSSDVTVKIHPPEACHTRSDSDTSSSNGDSEPISPSVAPQTTNNENKNITTNTNGTTKPSGATSSTPSPPDSDDEDEAEEESMSLRSLELQKSGSLLISEGVDTIKETLTKLLLFFTFQSTLEPNAKAKVAWDWYIICLALYSFLVTPCYIAFDYDLGGSLYGFDWFVTLCFALDILISFRTGFVDFASNTVFDARLIADRYLRSYFVIDLLATFPFHVFSPLIHFGPSAQFVDNCLKVNFLLRSSKVINSERVDAFISPQARISKLLFGFVALAHLFGCIFWFVGSIQTTQTTWIHAQNLQDKPHIEQYVASLYWALATMVTVGYGDIAPVTVYERGIVIPILMLSALIYATIFGNMAYAIETITSTIRRYQNKMDSVKEFVKVYELPTELQQKMYDYANAQWSQTKGFETSEMLSHLPVSVKADIMLFINKTLIERVPLFKQCSDRFLEAMILRMTSQVCLSGDFVFKEGDRSTEMFFVRSGTVEIIQEVQGADITIAEIGSYSDYPFFGEISLLLGETRTASARASSKCILSKLSQQDFFEVLSMFPEEENSLRETATMRLEQDMEREAKFAKKRERQMELQAQRRKSIVLGGNTTLLNNNNNSRNTSANRPISAGGEDGSSHSRKPSGDLQPGSSNNGTGETEMTHLHPTMAASTSKAENRLRHLEGGVNAGTNLVSPHSAQSVNGEQQPSSAGAGNDRLSRIHSTSIRHSVFSKNNALTSPTNQGAPNNAPTTPNATNTTTATTAAVVPANNNATPSPAIVPIVLSTPSGSPPSASQPQHSRVPSVHLDRSIQDQIEEGEEGTQTPPNRVPSTPNHAPSASLSGNHLLVHHPSSHVRNKHGSSLRSPPFPTHTITPSGDAALLALKKKRDESTQNFSSSAGGGKEDGSPVIHARNTPVAPSRGGGHRSFQSHTSSEQVVHGLPSLREMELEEKVKGLEEKFVEMQKQMAMMLANAGAAQPSHA